MLGTPRINLRSELCHQTFVVCCCKPLSYKRNSQISHRTPAFCHLVGSFPPISGVTFGIHAPSRAGRKSKSFSRAFLISLGAYVARASNHIYSSSTINLTIYMTAFLLSLQYNLLIKGKREKKIFLYVQEETKKKMVYLKFGVISFLLLG